MYGSPMLSSVTGPDDNPPVSKPVLANASVEEELLAEALNRGGCVGELIQEEDSLAFLTQPLWACVPGHIVVDIGKAT
jgi:hypothetical protein